MQKKKRKKKACEGSTWWVGGWASHEAGEFSHPLSDAPRVAGLALYRPAFLQRLFSARFHASTWLRCKDPRGDWVLGRGADFDSKLTEWTVIALIALHYYSLAVPQICWCSITLELTRPLCPVLSLTHSLTHRPFNPSLVLFSRCICKLSTCFSWKHGKVWFYFILFFLNGPITESGFYFQNPLNSTLLLRQQLCKNYAKKAAKPKSI